MEKIKTLTENEIKRIENSEDGGQILKNILGLKEYNLGDTTVKIDNAEKFGVYKKNWNGRDFYYLIMNVLSEDLAFAYSLYPIES